MKFTPNAALDRTQKWTDRESDEADSERVLDQSEVVRCVSMCIVASAFRESEG